MAVDAEALRIAMRAYAEHADRPQREQVKAAIEAYESHRAQLAPPAVPDMRTIEVLASAIRKLNPNLAAGFVNALQNSLDGPDAALDEFLAILRGQQPAPPAERPMREVLEAVIGHSNTTYVLNILSKPNLTVTQSAQRKLGYTNVEIVDFITAYVAAIGEGK